MTKIWSNKQSKLHYYNPGHETAVWQNSTHYTPPASVRAIVNDLALLPAWYADEGDYVFISRPEQQLSDWLPMPVHLFATPLTRKEIRTNAALLPRMEAAPWGLSPQSVHLFEELKQKEGLNIDCPVWKNEYVTLTNRQTAAGCLAEIQQSLPHISFPAPPVFLSQLEEVEDYLHWHTGPFVLKTPYSSSGRGLLWVNEKRLNDSERKQIHGIIRKQHTVSLEQALDKEADFAMEFYSDGKGSLRYEGLSIFITNRRGAYKGNRLQTQSALWQQLLKYTGEDTLNSIQQSVSDVLCHTFASRYTGYLGVDMLVYKKDKESFGIHPCIEINLRYTMGLTAIRLFENHIDSSAEGIFNILCENTPHLAYEQHILMKQMYPPTFKNGRLQKGYLSLCPVTTHTRYTACILAK
ncbi:MAG: hypothetical protein LBB84_08580 [Tannerellaceae bacterium]|nr:hypothetical protein [Tannerellaceae bacterium]